MASTQARRTYLLTPTMDERKWAKVPDIPADALYVDMEDSVIPELKQRARDKIADLVSDPAFLGGRDFVCRPNNLSTPWGREDLEALAEVRAPFVVYPKARTVDEVREVNDIFTRKGANPDLMILVETPHTVQRLQAIASCERVTALEFGPFDLALEAGIELFEGADMFRDGFLYAMNKCVMVGRALGLELVAAIAVKDLRDVDAVQRAAEYARRLGFTGMVTFYPPHVPVINAVMSPSADEIAWAQTVVAAYQGGVQEGRGAISVQGRAVTVHERQVAEQLLTAARTEGAV
jgi:citrate lyase beta subunit